MDIPHGPTICRSTPSAPCIEEVQLEPISTANSPSYDSQPCPREATLRDDPLCVYTSSRSSSRLTSYLLKPLTYSSPTLENKGNLARDYLSIERTWLAYMRTGILTACTGVGIIQLFATTWVDDRSLQAEATRRFGSSTTIHRVARPLGESAIILALCMIAVGMQRYFKVQRAIAQGIFPATRHTVVLISVAVATLAVVTFSVLLTLP